MWLLLSVQDVVDLHDDVLNPGELTGMAGDKSLEGALSRIDFRLQYGDISDEYDIAAMYAIAISQAHAFNDANKRTAFAAMDIFLVNNGIVFNWESVVVGDMIREVAQGNIDETELAAWLRQQKLKE